MRLTWLVTFLACLLGAAALSSVASAAEGKGERPPAPRFGLFPLEASNGYEAELFTVGNQVLIEAIRGDVGAVYHVRGKVTDRRIDARFGRLGRISGRYERVNLFGGKEGPDRNGCEDPFSFVAFKGTISFRGEGGYTSIEAQRAGGLLIDPSAARCRQRARASARRDSRLDTHLQAISRRDGAVTSFWLQRKRGTSWARLEALRQERRGEMQILRWATTVVGGDNALILSGPGVRPPFAFVEAPKPFSGSAVLDTSAKSGEQWTGSLAAWMPGLGKAGLAGSGYALSFCRRAGDEPGCDPEAPVRRELSAIQGSGSQSQLLAEARLSWSRYLRNSASSAGSTP